MQPNIQLVSQTDSFTQLWGGSVSVDLDFFIMLGLKEYSHHSSLPLEVLSF
jgi:hypothetical protein